MMKAKKRNKEKEKVLRQWKPTSIKEKETHWPEPWVSSTGKRKN